MENELSAISIILVFVMVTFSFLMPIVKDELNYQINNFEVIEDIQTQRLEIINKMIFLKVLPLTFFCLFLTYLLTPTSIETTMNYTNHKLALLHSWWDFDLLTTLFVSINILIFLMFIALLIIFCKLLKRKKELKKYFEIIKYLKTKLIQKILMSSSVVHVTEGMFTSLLEEERLSVAKCFYNHIKFHNNKTKEIYIIDFNNRKPIATYLSDTNKLTYPKK